MWGNLHGLLLWQLWRHNRLYLLLLQLFLLLLPLRSNPCKMGFIWRWDWWPRHGWLRRERWIESIRGPSGGLVHPYERGCGKVLGDARRPRIPCGDGRLKHVVHTKSHRTPGGSCEGVGARKL